MFHRAVPTSRRHIFDAGVSDVGVIGKISEEYAPGAWALLREEFFLRGVGVIQQTFGWRKTQAYHAAAAWGWNTEREEWKVDRKRRAQEAHNQHHALVTWGWRPGEWAVRLRLVTTPSALGAVGVARTPGKGVRDYMFSRGMRKYLIRWDGLERSVPAGRLHCGSSITVHRRDGRLEFVGRLFGRTTCN